MITHLFFLASQNLSENTQLWESGFYRQETRFALLSSWVAGILHSSLCKTSLSCFPWSLEGFPLLGSCVQQSIPGQSVRRVSHFYSWARNLKAAPESWWILRREMATTARAPCTTTPTLIPSWFSVSRDEAAAACSTSSGSVHFTLPSSPRFCRVCAAHPQLPRPNTGNKACPSLLRASGLSSSASWEGRSHLVHLLSSLRGLPISLSLSLSLSSFLSHVL